ncbi:NAD-dependent epimerase/dehydratase family protein [Telmatospirillum sp. J64-1]|uniref:NAD-dependent epimerase/dehydratase family protein n=1 Tax=Telmatospirillum sp. J64-1 TaxID=2502183 RepID=UPI00115F548E|nr:NAD-dependent epimerase/dehydratase family protein [Telmatospirillum sp. J64-1]
MTDRIQKFSPLSPSSPSSSSGLPAGMGIVEWLRPGEFERTERVIEQMKRMGVQRLRTAISWAEYHAENGQLWYDWLLPKLSREFDLLPCVTYTPPSLGIEPKSPSPPRVLKDYADFIDTLITRHGQHFEYIQLWNEPNNLNDWDWMMDPGWHLFAEMVGGAAYWVQQRGKKTVLAGMCPPDPNWLDTMCSHGVLEYIDAVALHGFPGTWQAVWPGWPNVIAQAREVLNGHGHDPEIWITEVGYSTWRCDEAKQVEHFLTAAEAPAERVYWYGWQDLDPSIASQEGFHFDERHYHLGLVRSDGSPKLLCRLLEEGGIERARDVIGLSAPAIAASPDKRPVLITGGAGFVGSNLADRIAAEGRKVLIFDNLSRAGVEENLAWLRHRHGERITAMLGDTRDAHALRDAVSCCAQVYHFAAQVAVTTSVTDPVTDFEINLRGTLNLLEAIRAQPAPPPLVFASTNKVYGKLGDLQLKERKTRYEPVDPALAHGVDESQPLDLYSPYGCSKGGADQYVLDYARIYGLQACVFRMSCLYGPRQFGTEDQGWVAHFLISARDGKPITIFGDGKQVRDVLFVEDVVEAFLTAQAKMPKLAGQAFNIGGGPANALSLLELIAMIGRMNGRRPELSFGDWRPGDQLYYVSDTRRFSSLTGWTPKVDAATGVARLNQWLAERQAVHAHAVAQ